MAERIEEFNLNLATNRSIFYNGPAEFLAKSVAERIRLVSQFSAIFGSTPLDSGYIDSYPRMDYAIRNLPALRIYDKGYLKQFESWFIDGDLYLDVIFPPNIRRNETQNLQDVISSALLQQFRRVTFFNEVSNLVPGLNELGKTFSVDKTLGFQIGSDIVPLTQIKANFRIDLRQWDKYLESTCRTKDEPFEETLEILERIVTTINALRDDNETTELQVGIDQVIEE